MTDGELNTEDAEAQRGTEVFFLKNGEALFPPVSVGLCASVFSVSKRATREI